MLTVGHLTVAKQASRTCRAHSNACYPNQDCHKVGVDPSEEKDSLSPFFLWQYLKQQQRSRRNSPERKKTMQLNKWTGEKSIDVVG
jgi:hypothetical protein